MLYHLSWLSENVGNENKFYDRKIEVTIKWKCPATKDTHKDTEKSEKSASEFGVVAYLLHHHHHHLSNELPFIRCLCLDLLVLFRADWCKVVENVSRQIEMNVDVV